MRKWKGPDWLRPQEADESTAYCRDVNCALPIFFRPHPRTRRPHPINPEGGSHFGTCVGADNFRSRDLDGVPNPDQAELDL